jgi:hypothetical protein
VTAEHGYIRFIPGLEGLHLAVPSPGRFTKKSVRMPEIERESLSRNNSLAKAATVWK